MTVVVGVAWAYVGGGEVELTLGSFRREEKQTVGQGLETKPMDFGQCNYVINEDLEIAALKLIANERKTRRVKQLVADADVTQAARSHAQDMVDYNYFSHADREGEDAGDRLERAGIKYEVVGENLAFAGNLATAHKGLMASQTHRSNILESRFGRVGVGVLDGGGCGVVEVQNFAD